MSIDYARPPSRRDDERTVAGRRRPMRRADREVTDPARIGEIIAACRIIHVAYADAEGLTIVPVNFGFDGSVTAAASGSVAVAPPVEAEAPSDDVPGLVFYMHSALHGRKIDALHASGNALPVAFEMETDCSVVEGRTPCAWGEAFASIVGTGTASTVDDPEECRHGLALIMELQAGMHVDFTDRQAATVTVWKIAASHVTAKIRPRPR